ncbi:MAG TPA: MFS transporter [Dongiaceae bacterium]|jgi:MFS family permease|nr:MFS transporter [Dongiaceae bacterium]
MEEHLAAPLLPWWRRFGGVLRHRNYRRYFLGQAFLLVGYWIHSIALAWLVWRLGGSPLLLGLLAFCDQGPTLVLGPIAGAVADRMDRRMLLLFTQSILVLVAAILALLTLSGAVTVEMAIGATLSIGIVNAFDGPTRQAFVAELVGLDGLRSAITLNSTLFNVARLVGPAIGGFLIAWAGEGYCFLAKALAGLPMIAVLAALQVRSIQSAAGRVGVLAEVAAGVRFVFANPNARDYLVIVGVCSFASVPYFSFLPMLAEDVLGGGPDAAGMLMSITGVGALVAALLLFMMEKMPLTWVPIGAAALQGASLILIGLSGTLWLTALLALPMGFAALSQQLSSNALLQQSAPDNMRGRVMAFYTMMLLGTVPVGAMVAGLSARAFGLPATTVLGGCTCLLIAACVAWLIKRRQ